MISPRTRSVGAALAVITAVVVGGASAASADRTPAPTGRASGSPARRPVVAVIGTGGTIAGVSASRVSFDDYRAGQLPVAKLVDALRPEVDEVADVRTVEYGDKASGDYTTADYHDLSLLVDRQLATADAVVVTTGTQTMEEFGYWLDLTVRSSKPVVLTGAMRPWTVIGSDGPPNLYNAILLAASRTTRCFGSVVMLNDEIFAARDVTKTDTSRLDTFASPELGELGTIDGSQIRLRRAPARVQYCARPERWRTPFDLTKVARDGVPKVEIAYTYQGASGDAVTAFAAAGAKGIVLAGSPSPMQLAAAERAISAGVVFVAASRNTSGAVYVSQPGLIAAEDLRPQKARILLQLALAFSSDPAQVPVWFARYGLTQFQAAG